jgi:hypothetical protein
LSGQTNFTQAAGTGSTCYYVFKANEVGSPTINTYAQDPWKYAYGYSTGNSSSSKNPYSGTGLYDLWSTGGNLLPQSTNTLAWITNWQQ